MADIPIKSKKNIIYSVYSANELTIFPKEIATIGNK